MKIGSLIFGVVCVARVVFGQGGLTPPGAPAPTMKTLDEISAAIAGTAHAAGQVESRIDVETLAGDGSSRHLVVVPGSYYLSSNLVVSNMNAIAVGCSGVTLDLNGFSIMQLASGTGEGVNISAVASGVSVRNGSIHNFNHGILGAGSNNCFKTLSFFYNLAGLASGPSSRMINCHAYHNNGVYGINAGEGSVLSGCSAYYSGGKGIQTADDCTLDRCLSYNNNGGGIYVGVGCSLNACSAKDNVGFGIHTSTDCVLKSCMATENGGAGFTGGAANAFSDCAALDNTGTGFNVAQVCRLKDCVAKGNQGNGINALFGANLSGCNASDNHGAYGICVGLASRVARCNASENSSSTTAESGGIYADEGCLLLGCSAGGNANDGNTAVGIRATGATTIQNCTVNRNQGHGIRIYSDCRVVGNQCAENEAGIYASGSGNRMDENHLQGNAYGMVVDAAGNLIVRNSASGNRSGNYSITETQTIGPIYTTSSLVILGEGRNSWGNYSY